MSNSKNSTTRMIAQIGMLSALAAVLMYLEIPLPFLAPPFYKMDFSEVPVMVGAFAMGPIPGALIELIKVLIKLVLKGTSTAFVGDIANFLMGCAYVLPAAIIYRCTGKKSRTRAAVGLIAGTLITSVIAALLNAFVLLPAYSKAFGAPIDTFIQMGASIHPSINGLFGFALLIVVPFNLFKYTLVSIIVLLIYKHIRVILKSF